MLGASQPLLYPTKRKLYSTCSPSWILWPIARLYWADNTTWVTDGKHALREILMNDGTSTDDGIAPYRYSRQDLNASTKPNIIPDSYGSGIFKASITSLGIHWMQSCIQTDIGC